MEWLKQNWITVAVVVAVAFVLWSTLGRRKATPGESIQVNVKCPKCGWKGIVSKYNAVCPKCANKSLESF